MPTSPRPRRDLSKVTVNIDPGGIGSGRHDEGGGPLEGGLTLMNRFTAEIHDPALSYEVTLTVAAARGRLVCESLTVRQHNDVVSVTGTGLRAVPVESYLQRIREELARYDGGFVLMKRRDDGAAAWSPPPEDAWKGFEGAQRRRTPPETVLPRVVHAYREALANPDPGIRNAPTAYVARQLGYHRGHAARLVATARKERMLGPARTGQGGEAASLST